MNKSSIATARDADLRLSAQALRRAAQRAREVARQTGTAIVVTRDGVVEMLYPLPADAVQAQESFESQRDERMTASAPESHQR